MVEVTKLNGQNMVVNGDMIEKIESTPDTMLKLSSGRTVIVKETVSELLDKLKTWRKESARDVFGEEIIHRNSKTVAV